MGIAIGVILSFISVGLLIIPFIIDLVISGKEDNAKNHKNALRAAAAFTGIAAFLLLIAIIVLWIESGKCKGGEGEGGGEGGGGVSSLLGSALRTVEENPELLA